MHIVDATGDDVRARFPEFTAGIVIGTACRDDAGKTLGVGGVLVRPDGHVVGFLDCDDAVRRRPILMHKAALAFLRRWAGMAQTLRIVVDTKIPRAEAWATRLGFVRLDDNVWLWRA